MLFFPFWDLANAIQQKLVLLIAERCGRSQESLWGPNKPCSLLLREMGLWWAQEEGLSLFSTAVVSVTFIS